MGLLALVTGVGFLVLLIGGTAFVVAQGVRAAQRGSGGGREIEALKERTLLLEQRLAELGENVERIAEGQEFTTRLLLGRK